MSGLLRSRSTNPNIHRESNMSDITAILADTTAHGFAFVTEDVAEGVGPDKRTLGKGPVLVITDPTLFERSFPGRITAMLDGSSARVIGQGAIRRALKKDHKASDAEMRPLVLSSILAVKARMTVDPMEALAAREGLVLSVLKAWIASQKQ